jgi:hypothetical protein
MMKLPDLVEARPAGRLERDCDHPLAGAGAHHRGAAGALPLRELRQRAQLDLGDDPGRGGPGQLHDSDRAADPDDQSGGQSCQRHDRPAAPHQPAARCGVVRPGTVLRRRCHRCNGGRRCKGGRRCVGDRGGDPVPYLRGRRFQLRRALCSGHGYNLGQPRLLSPALRAVFAVLVIRCGAGPFAQRPQGEDRRVSMRHRWPPAWCATAAGCGGCGSSRCRAACRAPGLSARSAML